MSAFSSVLVDLHYFGCLEYMRLYQKYPHICIETQEHYTKGSYRNRTYIATANGVLGLSLPLLAGKNEGQLIRDTKLDYGQRWQLQHWKSLKTAYGRAPFWEYYESDLRGLYARKDTFLFDFNLACLEWVLAKLKIRTQFAFSETYTTETEPHILDARAKILPPPSPENLGVDGFESRPYTQLFADRQPFCPNLSVLDALMCLGKLPN
jgi:WbqC-like protein family